MADEPVPAPTATRWSRVQQPAGVVRELQAEGLDGALGQKLADLQSDPQLAQREHFQGLTRTVAGAYVVEANGIRVSGSPHGFTRPPPCPGAGGEFVSCHLLGLTKQEFDELTAVAALT